MKLNTDTHFQTRELYFAAYLFSKGYKLTAIKLDNGGAFFWFIFTDKQKCEEEEQRFLKNDVSVKAKEFSEAIRYLKRKVSQ